VAVTDANRVLVERTYYSPYGIPLNHAINGPGYTGHVIDLATGLTYMQQRYYDPSLGRFLSIDPVASDINNGWNFNRYNYAANNPYKFTDPDGRNQALAYTQWWAGVKERVQTAASMNSGIFHTAGTAIATDVAYLVGAATDNAALQNAAVDGFQESVGTRGAIEAVVGLATSGRSGEKTSTTYTRTKTDGTVYSGRTSGRGTPEQQVATRTSNVDHQAKTQAGYGPAVVDKNSPNADAIRGREQQLILQNGGAQSQGGTSGNAINGVSPTNPRAETYKNACKAEFGC
jgi:RHS repeat-associated protein